MTSHHPTTFRIAALIALIGLAPAMASADYILRQPVLGPPSAGSTAPTLGGFSVPALTVGALATLTPPSSNSSGAWTYSSSDPNVATVSGSTLTAVGAGTASITARQAANGSYQAASVSAAVTVTAAPAGAPDLVAYNGTGQAITGPFNFGNVAIGQSYSYDVVAGRIYNGGTAAATLNAPVVSGNAAFSVKAGGSSNCAEVGSLPPNSYCNVYANFAPTTEGVASATYYLSSTDGHSAGIDLTGTGFTPTPNIGVSRTTIDFGSVALGNSGTLAATFTNSGTAAGTIAGLTQPAAPFSGTTDCPSTLAAGAQCTVTFTFNPSAAGAYSSSATMGGFTFSLTGATNDGQAATWSSAGNMDGSVTPPTAAFLNFGTAAVGSTTTYKYFWVVNTGVGGSISVGASLSGSGASQFRITSIRRSAWWGQNSCNAGGTIAANGLSVDPCLADVKTGSMPYVWIQVRFNPTVAGSFSATLTPTSNNGTALPGALTLTGTAQ